MIHGEGQTPLSSVNEVNGRREGADPLKTNPDQFVPGTKSTGRCTMSERTSNTTLLAAIEAMPAAIAEAMAGNSAMSPSDDEPQGKPIADNDTVNVDGAYLSHVTSKLQARANDDGQTYVLYARKNVAGQTKLAYCLGSKWTSLTDKRIIGAVKTVAPE